MTLAPPVYDLVLMLDPAAEESVRTQILSDTREAIAGRGTPVGEQDWGQRTMAYPIDHATDAVYHLFQFNAPRELLEHLERTLRITDGVVRHRIIKLAPGTPAPDSQMVRRPEGESAPASAPAPAAA